MFEYVSASSVYSTHFNFDMCSLCHPVSMEWTSRFPVLFGFDREDKTQYARICKTSTALYFSKPLDRFRVVAMIYQN